MGFCRALSGRYGSPAGRGPPPLEAHMAVGVFWDGCTRMGFCGVSGKGLRTGWPLASAFFKLTRAL